jgi:site-specific recombinase XerC
MLACALEDDEITSNPAADARYIPTEAARVKHAKSAPRRLTATDLVAIIQAMPVEWRAFFFTLAHTGVRIGELLGLTWGNVHLGDHPHIKVVEQVYRGQRKKLKTDTSEGEGAAASFIASWLAELRPENANDESLGSADAFDEILDAEALRAGQPRGNPGATEHPEAAVKPTPAESQETV